MQCGSPLIKHGHSRAINFAATPFSAKTLGSAQAETRMVPVPGCLLSMAFNIYTDLGQRI